MELLLNASDVRKNWSDTIDEVTHQKPKFVARNNKNPFLMMSLEQVKSAFEAYNFSVNIEEEDDGSFTTELENFDLFTNAETKEAALNELAEDLREYSREYFKNIELYYNAPNRRNHFPYIMKVLLQEDLEGVLKLFNAK